MTSHIVTMSQTDHSLRMPPVVTAPFALSTLGYPSFQTALGEQVRLRTRKHFAVLIRLALAAGHRCSRDELMEMLWPDVPAKLARHSLAQAITVVKSKVGREKIAAARNAVSLAAGTVDVDALEIGRKVVDVAGAFLEGFDIPGARGFDQWKDEWTAKLLPRIRDCLVGQMDAGRRLGDFATVERHASTLLQFDPLSEDGIRGVMEARAWVGDRTSALKAYDAYVGQLAEVLGARPSPDINRMASLLREGHPPARPGHVSEPTGRRERRMEAETIIGRTREFSLLYDSWREVRSSAPRVVVITGEPGIGKTTLTNAFSSSCQMEGAVVARVQAYDAERELPFAVLAELVRQLAVQRAIGAAEPEALAELARVCADVGTAFPGIPRPPDWAAEVIPIRLADALLKSVTAAAEESPVVLVVDDAHAADNSSAAILHMLARKLDRVRFMLILVARASELRSAGTGSLAADSSLGCLAAVEVGALSSEAARELVTRLTASSDYRDPPVDRILDAGRGNALALELLAREWADHGPDSLLRDLEAINTTPAPRIGIPAAVRNVFEREVRRLDPAIRSALDFAAVLGRRLHEVELYHAVGLTPIAAASALARLMDEGFLREVQGVLEFRNELIRAQAYYALPNAGREHLHRAAAEALGNLGSGGRAGAELEVAWHFIRGRVPERAVTFAIEGAERSLERGAPNEAEQVLRAVEHRPTDRVRAMMLLTQALLDQSKGEEASPYLDELWITEGASPLDHARIAAMKASAEYMLARETGPRHTAAAEEALRAAQHAGAPALVAKALNVLSRAYGETGNGIGLDQVRHDIDRLVQYSEYKSLPMIHYTAGYCEYVNGSAHRAAEHVRHALELAQAGSRPTDTIPLLNGLGVSRHQGGDHASARRLWEEGLALARRIGDDAWSCTFATNLCGILVHEGRPEEAISYGLEGARLARRALKQPRSVMTFTNLANAYLLKFEQDKVLEFLELARATLDRESNWEPRVVYYSETACAQLALGNVPAALEAIGTLGELIGSRSFGPVSGTFERLKAFKTAHQVGALQAIAHAKTARTRLQERHVLDYLGINAGVAWLERQVEGAVSQQTQEGIDLYDRLGLLGTKAILRMEGFIA